MDITGLMLADGECEIAGAEIAVSHQACERGEGLLYFLHGKLA